MYFKIGIGTLTIQLPIHLLCSTSDEVFIVTDNKSGVLSFISFDIVMLVYFLLNSKFMYAYIYIYIYILFVLELWMRYLL
jgi:hypothetical protein